MKRRPWTHAEEAVLAECYPHLPTDLLAEALHRSTKQAYAKAAAMGLAKTEDYLRTAGGRLQPGDGEATRFPKGNAPWNKGMKGLDIGGHATRFQKGQLSGQAQKNYKPIGSERLSRDGYLQRKIHDGQPAQSRWRGVHLLLWEATHGPIPESHAVVFKNGNKQDIRLDNLELVTRGQLMARNTLHNYPKEIALAIQLRGAINRQINRRQRKAA